MVSKSIGARSAVGFQHLAAATCQNRKYTIHIEILLPALLVLREKSEMTLFFLCVSMESGKLDRATGALTCIFKKSQWADAEPTRAKEKITGDGILQLAKFHHMLVEQVLI